MSTTTDRVTDDDADAAARGEAEPKLLLRGQRMASGKSA